MANTIIDSHSSGLTNKEMHLLFLHLDSTAIQTAASPDLQTVEHFYQSLDHVYGIIESIMPDANILKIRKIKEQYEQILNLIDTDKSIRTKRTLRYMHTLCKEFHREIRSGLQKYGYHFRIGKRETKSLTAIDEMTRMMVKEENGEEKHGDN